MMINVLDSLCLLYDVLEALQDMESQTRETRLAITNLQQSIFWLREHDAKCYYRNSDAQDGTSSELCDEPL